MASNNVNPSNINYIGKNDFGISYFPKVNCLKMHIRCYNNPNIFKLTKPTVVFDSGVPFPGLAYSNVIQSLIPYLPFMNVGRLCFFDRYGYGFSDSSPKPVNSDDIAFYLYESLQEAKINPPFIMAAWSYSSITIQLFALKYMKDVVGMLFIDGTEVSSAYLPYMPGLIEAEIGQVQQLLNWTVEGTIQDHIAEINPGYGYIPSGSPLYAPAAAKINQWFFTENFLKTVLQELSIQLESCYILNSKYIAMNTTHPLSNIPLALLTAIHPPDESNYNFQTKIAALSTTSIRLNVTSSHFIPMEQPGSIANALSVLVSNYVDKHVPIKVLEC